MADPVKTKVVKALAYVHIYDLDRIDECFYCGFRNAKFRVVQNSGPYGPPVDYNICDVKVCENCLNDFIETEYYELKEKAKACEVFDLRLRFFKRAYELGFKPVRALNYTVECSDCLELVNVYEYRTKMCDQCFLEQYGESDSDEDQTSK